MRDPRGEAGKSNGHGVRNAEGKKQEEEEEKKKKEEKEKRARIQQYTPDLSYRVS